MPTADRPARAAPAPCHRFGDFELRPLERELLHRGGATRLGSRAFDLLVVLVERAGHLFSREDLLEAVWCGVVVEENNLEKQISALRKVIGAHAIRTVSGYGYRFVMPVCTAEPLGAAARPSQIDSGVVADILQVLDATAAFRELADDRDL